MRQRRQSTWAQITAEYLEIAEARGVAEEYLKEGTLTVFSGITFTAEDPYTYPQAKRMLGLLFDELRRDRRLQRQLGTDPNSKGRGAITGRTGQAVWDFVSLKSAPKAFTQYPHLTIGIMNLRFEAYLTIPNGVRARLRNKMLGGSYEEFERLIVKVTRLLSVSLRKYPGASPMLVVVQRRYLTSGPMQLLTAYFALIRVPRSQPVAECEAG